MVSTEAVPEARSETFRATGSPTDLLLVCTALMVACGAMLLLLSAIDLIGWDPFEPGLHPPRGADWARHSVSALNALFSIWVGLWMRSRMRSLSEDGRVTTGAETVTLRGLRFWAWRCRELSVPWSDVHSLRISTWGDGRRAIDVRGRGWSVWFGPYLERPGELVQELVHRAGLVKMSETPKRTVYGRERELC